METDEIIEAARNGTLRLVPDDQIDLLALRWSQAFQEANRENIPRDMFPDVFADETDVRDTPGSTIFASRRDLEANVKVWVRREQIDIQVGTPDWEALINECHCEYLTANPEVSDQWFGVLQDRGMDLDERYRNAFKAAQRPKITDPKTRLSAVFKKYVDESELGPSAINDFGVGVRRFQELLGDISIDEIDRDHVVQFKESLRKLPSRPPYHIRKKPVSEQVAWAEGLDIKRLGSSAVNKNLMGVKLTLQFGFEQTNIISNRDWRNPFDGFLKKPKSAENPIKPFTTQQVRLIFSELVFQPKKVEEFWIPLILLFTGARLDEISQLHVTDVRKDPVPHI